MKRLITALFFLLSLFAYTWGGTVGRIQGKVTDLQTGQPLIGANVIVVGTNFGAATDVNGEFTIDHLDPGVYEVKASYIGYQNVTTSNVRVSADLTTTLNFQLPAQGVQVGEVHVVAQRPLVNTSNTNAIRVTTSEQIDALPIRGINNIIALTPGVIQQEGRIYIRGGRQDETGYYLEGTNISNPLVSYQGGPQHSATQVTVPQNAIEEVQVQAGGYTAEFGGANAGIIRSQLKTGGSQFSANLQYITDNWTFKSKADRYDGVQHLGTYSYGYNDMLGSISGPLVGDHIKFYATLENLFQADRDPTAGLNGFNYGTVNGTIPVSAYFPNPVAGDTVNNFNYPGGPVPGNSSNQYNAAATVSFDYNPTIVRLLGTFSFDRQRLVSANPTLVMYDLNRLPIRDDYNGDFGIKVTHILSANAYVELNASYIFNKGKTYDPQLGDDFMHYGDAVANANAGVPWVYSTLTPANQQGRYNVPGFLQLYSELFFATPNEPLIEADQNTSITNYNKFENDNLDINAAFSDQLNEQNSLKIGGEVQIMKIRNYTPTNVVRNIASLINSNPDLSIDQILIKNGVNNYGYDVTGNVYNGANDYTSGALAPHKPVFLGAYIEDQIQYKNLIVNAGLRYDYFNTDNLTLSDPSNPGNVFNISSDSITNGGNLKKVPSFSSLSPRLGFSFPITDETVFHAQYGKFVQQPSLNDLYQGLYAFGASANPNFGYAAFTPVGIDLRPTRTTQYEMGFTQQIGSFASFDITAYYKDITNQVVYGVQNTVSSSGWRPYYILANGDYATTEGFEFAFHMRRTDGFLVDANVSFQDGRGTGDNPYSNVGEVQNPVNNNYVFTPQYIEPLSYNHTLNGNLNIDYHFGKDEVPSVLQEFGASLLLTFSSGHPYTLGDAQTPGVSNPFEATGAIDPRHRFAIEPLNSSVTPSNFQVDMRIDKRVELPENLSADIFIQVINLFNALNVQDVFNSTGSPVSDGYLTNPALTGYQKVASIGPEFANIYNDINIQYQELYGTPRQIRLGIQLEY
jgi:TonB dependent receptor-like, beta-barrel/CarboxypepD_reg-like domain/TonB-dependent Receptor Plug Domain